MEPVTTLFRFPYRSPHKPSLVWSTFTAQLLYDLSRLDRTSKDHAGMMEAGQTALFLGATEPPAHQLPGAETTTLAPTLEVFDNENPGEPIRISLNQAALQTLLQNLQASRARLARYEPH